MTDFDRRMNPGRIKKISPVPQVAAGDCGLACLAMVLQAHGSDIGIQELRGKLDTSINGISLKRIIYAAGQYKLSGRAVRVEIQSLRELRLPAILHWNFNHYVVLESVDKLGAVIIDPSSGRRRMQLSDISGHFTGIAVDFWRMPEYSKVRQIIRTSLTEFWTSIRGAKRSVMLIIALSLTIQCLLLVSPLLFSVMIDQAVKYSSIDMLVSIFAAIVLAMLLAVMGDLVRRFSLLTIGTQLISQVNLSLVNHLLRLPYQFFQQRRLSDLLSRVDSTRVLKDALTEGAIPILVDGIFSIAALIILFTVHPIVAMITTGFVLAFVILKIVTYPALRARAEVIDRQADEQAVLMETLRGMQVIKTMNAERLRLSTWHGASVAALNSNQKVQEATSMLTAARSAIIGLDFACIAALCSMLVIKGQMTIGVLFAVIALRQQFQDRAYPLIERSFDFRLVHMRLQRLADITQTPQEIPDGITKTGMSLISAGRIELDSVKYRYASDLPWVVDSLSLDISPGEFLAINGQSGGGKSTLVRLLIGLLRPNEGEIRVDGVALNEHSVEAYRSEIAVVMQDDQLFTGTIFDNISGFDPDSDFDAIKKAAELADVSDDIERMPMGYFSFIGDMGSSLSGGQQQRILLARALYRKPKILFLDEGTANLDPLRENRIVGMLKSLGITIICVAHRSRTLEEADRVFEMRDGCLLQSTKLLSASPPSPLRLASTGNISNG
jgi:ATP-binding cassette, subfamily B, bacterial CvaB/MchF/RaxB